MRKTSTHLPLVSSVTSPYHGPGQDKGDAPTPDTRRRSEQPQPAGPGQMGEDHKSGESDPDWSLRQNREAGEDSEGDVPPLIAGLEAKPVDVHSKQHEEDERRVGRHRVRDYAKLDAAGEDHRRKKTGRRGEKPSAELVGHEHGAEAEKH